jgi:putative FmdB family regulatory protein
VPIYEYQCAKCDRVIEVMQKITDEPLQKCPYCKGNLRRLISLNSFHLKGNGWYVTDYKNRGKDNRGKPSKQKEVKADKKSDKKTESTSTA